MAENENLYVKKDKSVLVNTNKNFIYEVNIFCLYKSHYSIVNTAYYSCNKEIPNIVECFRRDSHTIIKCELLSAPFPWLLENQYIKYVKPDKKVSTKKKIDQNGGSQVTVTKRGISELIGKPNRSRAKKS